MIRCFNDIKTAFYTLSAQVPLATSSYLSFDSKLARYKLIVVTSKGGPNITLTKPTLLLSLQLRHNFNDNSLAPNKCKGQRICIVETHCIYFVSTTLYTVGISTVKTLFHEYVSAA